MSQRLFFNLETIPSKKNQAGSLACVTAKEVPGFIDISFNQLKLNREGFQEPIWHPNAHKIGYCQQGNALISLRTPNGLDVFSLEPGDVFFIPKGSAHSILNLGEQENIINFALNSASPEVMYFSKALDSLSDDVFAVTFDTFPTFVNQLKKAQNSSEMMKMLSSQGHASFFDTSSHKSNPTSQFKFNLEASHPLLETRGGYLKSATKTNLSILEGLGILGFELTPKGIVEPHWHTNAGELVYIEKGRTRITVLSPDGNIEELEVNAGQGAFAAASHFHNIENIGDENVKVIAFFSNAQPDYMGFGEVLGSYSNEMLASIFGVSPGYFDKLKKPSGPLVILPL